MASAEVSILPVTTKADRKAFIDLAYRLNASDPHWVPPLRADVEELLNPAKNPFFEHAEVQLFLAYRGGQVVGRISAHFDRLAWTLPPEQGMGPGTGNWGLFEAEDEAVAAALIETAEEWLHQQGMTRVLAPISLSIWDEPGLLVKGFDHDPVIMMGHHSPRYRAWIEARGYGHAKSLLTYDLPIADGFPPLINRIVASGEKNPRIRIRRADKSRFKEEAELVFHILNDAWSQNWGFVPITQREIDYVAKKMKPIIREDLLMIAEVDGEPVAFMLTFPDLNRVIKPFGGKLFPFNFIKLLLWARKPVSDRMRVPLMGVVKKLQSSRLASQLAFMMIEYIRREAVSELGAKTAEIGWILDDNQGMIAIADAIDSKVNREYVIYQKGL
ncbi:N-acetyltransferase [Novosphingobium sp. JCM 18896]|uniref:N-acetyltransferase n=1 Tax=Novosphingobium sp. JCM 18896 TaxID=2989731 RepID=UPI0022223F72|nr:N-acetyltransferase [Novosphingobium sp. JCM 18896]MCW1428687.1 N-acetyltransferase [Novosphingobium sp. JCM 18896]